MPEPVNPNIVILRTIQEHLVRDLGWEYEVSEDGTEYILTCKMRTWITRIPVTGPGASSAYLEAMNRHAREHGHE